jgi:hypothetical protein
MGDPTLAKIIIDPQMAPGTTRYNSAEGVWRVHSENEARLVSDDRGRWVWAGTESRPANPAAPPADSC